MFLILQTIDSTLQRYKWFFVPTLMTTAGVLTWRVSYHVTWDHVRAVLTQLKTYASREWPNLIKPHFITALTCAYPKKLRKNVVLCLAKSCGLTTYKYIVSTTIPRHFFIMYTGFVSFGHFLDLFVSHDWCWRHGFHNTWHGIMLMSF